MIPSLTIERLLSGTFILQLTNSQSEMEEKRCQKEDMVSMEGSIYLNL